MSIEGRPVDVSPIRRFGAYEAIVISQLDPKRSGALQVELLKNTTAGNQPERSGQIVTVQYLSPFAGITPLNATSDNDTFQATQKSYGMWMIPPDPGTRVLVVFTEGNLGKGYWIGCIQDTYMNWMTPDPWAGTQFHNKQGDESRNLPTGEFNKVRQTGAGTDPTRYIKPYNEDFYTILGRQGLLDDEVRGPANSSSRREVPSMVFGISTPGPLDKRDGAPKATIGTSDSRTQVFASRLGGSSLVFDDGDETRIRKSFAGQGPKQYSDLTKGETEGLVQIPYNECVRLRTRTGHQILLHNSEDLIYIGNASGSTWLELTSNGKIDIFADDSISIRTSVDVNISSDRDINLTAARDINFNAGRDYKLTVNQNYDTKVGVNAKFDIGADYDQFVGATQKVYVGGEGNLIVAGAHKITNLATLDIKTNGARKDTQANLSLKSGGYNHFTSGGNTEILAANILASAGRIDLNGPGAAEAAEAGAASQATSATPAYWPVRVPEHEPWKAHEHLDPLTFTPALTQASTSPSPSLRNTTPLVNSNSDAVGTANTSTEATGAANQRGEQRVVPGVVGPVGEQPSKPVPVTDQQRFFLNELIKGIGLNPATCLKSANPADLAPGETPGNAQALGMAMAQVQAECGFRPRSENLNYSAAALRRVFPNRVRTDQFAQELAAAGPAAIGNTIYGGRLGNAQDEGYKYRGRGLIQLTFKDNYRRYGGLGGCPQIVENPDLANDPIFATKIAVAYLKSKSISWNSFDFGALGEQFRRAVGYADQGGAETSKRIGLGRGFASKLITGELTPVASITTEPAGTNIEAGRRAPT